MGLGGGSQRGDGLAGSEHEEGRWLLRFVSGGTGSGGDPDVGEEWRRGGTSLLGFRVRLDLAGFGSTFGRAQGADALCKEG